MVANLPHVNKGTQPTTPPTPMWEAFFCSGCGGHLKTDVAPITPATPFVCGDCAQPPSPTSHG